MRKRFLSCALGLAGALWLVPSAAADTATVGAAASPGTLFAGSSDFTVIQRASDPASPSFAVPPLPAGGSSWSVTSWGALGGAGNGTAALEIWRPTGTPGQLRLIAIGPQQDFPAGVLTTYAVSIPVQPGDHLGVLSGSGTGFSPTYSSGLSGDEAIWPNGGGTPAVGQTIGAPGSDFYPNGGTSGNRANVQAVVTSVPATPAPGPAKKKCKKKKKKKRSADAAKKKKCKKKKKGKR